MPPCQGPCWGRAHARRASVSFPSRWRVKHSCGSCLGRAPAGKHPDVQDHEDSSDAHAVPSPWLEAAAAVQCDLDLDVRSEAHGLVVAEMADVRMHERLAATRVGDQVTVVVSGGRRLTGRLLRVGSDFIAFRAAATIVVPTGAIVGIGRLPRVLHEEHVRPSVSAVSWRSHLREMLGNILHISAAGMDVAGRLTWVGHDHLSIASSSFDNRLDDQVVEVTIPWSRVDAITGPID